MPANPVQQKPHTLICFKTEWIRIEAIGIALVFAMVICGNTCGIVDAFWLPAPFVVASSPVPMPVPIVLYKDFGPLHSVHFPDENACILVRYLISLAKIPPTLWLLRTSLPVPYCTSKLHELW